MALIVNYMCNGMFYLTAILASEIWLRTIHIKREETHSRHYIGYSFRLAAMDRS